MMKIKLHRLIVSIIFIMLVFCYQSTVDAQVVCDKFKLNTELKGSTLNISIDTDTPDDTIISITVSRTYWEKGNPAAYSVDYLYKHGTAGKWRSKHSFTLDNEKWKSALKTKQKEMSRFGLGFDVASISDKIILCAVIPQQKEKFGKDNIRLIGKAVKVKYGYLHIAEDEVEITYPLSSPPIGKSSFPNLNPLELEMGPIYIVSKQTPLMPHYSPDDPMRAMQKIKQIPAGGKFKVLQKAKVRGTLWYKVIAYDNRGKQIGIGWINSIALLGQQLEVEK